MENNHAKSISGFSKLSKIGKLKWIAHNFFRDPERVMKELTSYWHQNEDQQKIFDDLSENSISNFILPFSVAPNFIINGKEYVVPMVIEESSVVAAASKAAKFWSKRGGFHARVISTIKEGCVYFESKKVNIHSLISQQQSLFNKIRESTKPITEKMESRGGGIVGMSIEPLDLSEPTMFKLALEFNTCDSMGANFINSVLEQTSILLKNWFETHFQDNDDDSFQVIMSILTNYTPKCIVEAWAECSISNLGEIEGYSAADFASRFFKAIRIAQIDHGRATTHNKGIYNGIDAVVLATGNDFRAIEAGGHAYAARSGKYSSLSACTIENGMFRFSLQLPLAVGTVGGLTSIHPIAKKSLELLGNPSAPQLMEIIAVAGLAQNFAAVKSLVTTGIQKGHMRMHLQNILTQLHATKAQTEAAIIYFQEKTISFSAVRTFLKKN